MRPREGGKGPRVHCSAEDYMGRQEMWCKRRKLISTGLEYLGLAPHASVVGDEIWLLLGLRAPIILRRLENGNRTVLGEAYVHGFMLGEAFDNGLLEVGKSTLLTLE